jgi:hypothetical protein
MIERILPEFFAPGRIFHCSLFFAKSGPYFEESGSYFQKVARISRKVARIFKKSLVFREK